MVGENVHHSPPHVSDRYDTVFLAIHGLCEQGECLLDLGLLARRDVVFLCELGLPLFGRRRGDFALWRL